MIHTDLIPKEAPADEFVLVSGASSPTDISQLHYPGDPITQLDGAGHTPTISPSLPGTIHASEVVPVNLPTALISLTSDSSDAFLGLIMNSMEALLDRKLGSIHRKIHQQMSELTTGVNQLKSEMDTLKELVLHQGTLEPRPIIDQPHNSGLINLTTGLPKACTVYASHQCMQHDTPDPVSSPLKDRPYTCASSPAESIPKHSTQGSGPNISAELSLVAANHEIYESNKQPEILSLSTADQIGYLEHLKTELVCLNKSASKQNDLLVHVITSLVEQKAVNGKSQDELEKLSEATVDQNHELGVISKVTADQKNELQKLVKLATEQKNETVFMNKVFANQLSQLEQLNKSALGQKKEFQELTKLSAEQKHEQVVANRNCADQLEKLIRFARKQSDELDNIAGICRRARR